MISLYNNLAFGAIRVDVCIKKFPDNTANINVDKSIKLFDDYEEALYIDWKYENEEELAHLIYLTKHIKNMNPTCKLSLRMPYIPNARMDRVERMENVFTLKYFCEVINWLEFDKVFVFDPHSEVSTALLNRVHVINKIEEYVERIQCKIINNIGGISDGLDIDDDDIILYYPDEGAAKKYSKILKDAKYCYGKKIRDWDTGNILGLDIANPYNLDLCGKYIIMIDDIISYGGTMYFGAKKLKEMGVGNIVAYTSHAENSILNHEKSKILKAFEEDIIKMVYTTNSIFTGNHEKIEVI